MQYRAGECRTQTVAEDRNLSPRPVWRYEEVGGGTQGRRLGQTEASDNPCGSMRIKSSLTRPMIRRRKAKENNLKKGTAVRAGPKRRNRSQEESTKALRAFPPVSQRRRKQSCKREREKRATERRRGRGVSLAVCPTVQEHVISFFPTSKGRGSIS